jgi:hypothetical protein
MNGSEKQIGWAEQIKTEVMPAFDRLAAKLAASKNSLEGEEFALASRIIEAIDDARQNESAAWWIDSIGSPTHSHGDMDGSGRALAYLRGALGPSPDSSEDERDDYLDLFDSITD